MPNNLISEVGFSKHDIHEHAQVGVGGVIAVEVYAPRFFEESMALKHSCGHHDEVVHHARQVHFVG